MGLFFKSGATFSPCKLYRYNLWRTWSPGKPIMSFVLQNPSTADAKKNDPTIRRCIGFAEREGMGGIYIKNVFAYRATDENEMLDVADPIGPDNLDFLSLESLAPQPDRLVVAWGNQFGNGKFANHYRHVAKLMMESNPYCLGVNQCRNPKHPLFLAKDTELVPWEGL